MEALIYLDTHVLIWLYTPKKDLLSDGARKRIDESGLLISPMALLELDFLREIGRISVGGDTIYQELHQKIGLKICDLEFLEVIKSAMGLGWTRDPFDRVIAGHALAADRDLVTRDEHILRNCPRARW